MSSSDTGQATLAQVPVAPHSPEPTMKGLKRPRLVASLAGILLSLLLAAMDQTIVSTALPRIVADLRGLEHYAWVVTAYLVASTAVAPVAGKLSDIYGRKPLFIIGIVLFLAASALCGISQTMAQLIVFRSLQGLGAGVIMASVFTAIADIFPPAERGKWQGLLGAVFGIASVVGPAAGGYLTESWSWRLVFYVNLPLGMVALAVVAAGLPHTQQHRRRPPIDYWGVALLVATVVPLLLALSLGGREFAWTSPPVLGLFAMFLASLGLFLLVEARVAEPIVPLTLFRNSIFTVSIGATFLTAMGMFGSLIFVPLYVQAILGGSPTEAGAVLTPMMLSNVVGSVVGGQAVARWGRYRIIALIGIAIMSLGMFLLTGLRPGVDSLTIVRDGVLVGFGLGITFPVYVIAVQNAFPYQVLGQVTASLQFFRSIGATVGVAVLGALMTTRFQGELRTGLPSVATGDLRADQIARLTNPDVLLTPNALDRLTQEIGASVPGASALAAQVYLAVRSALALALHDVFIVAFGVTLLCLGVTFFLREIPLRRTHHEAPIASTDARRNGNDSQP
ncbi:MAG: MFS transporter [Chloroflexi bacterium]|nr:MFS transporter [Chloroflexota bacterium]